MKETFDISGWQKAKRKKLHDREIRRKDLLKDAKRKVFHYFSEEKKVKSVFLVGSILQPAKFHQYSDIDIAVEGLPETSYFRTKVELEELLNVSVDLIELENCTFREMIVKNGLRIL